MTYNPPIFKRQSINMKKFCILWLLAALTAMNMAAQTRELHIVSANDMHASLDNMPILAAIVDSLREVDKNLLVFSAGDNRTGNPVNDLYPTPSYPMTSLMNLIGFDASAIGNHEFDSRQEGLAKVISTSNFPYLCANMKADPAVGIHTEPYHIYFVDGIKIGVLGVVELGVRGIPSAHPDFLKGLSFISPEEAIRQYEWLRKEVDVYILLSHIGYEEDVEMAKKFPYFDLIIGGHTHTQLDGGEMHNGVLVTQNENKIKRVTYITLKLEGKKVVGKTAKNIEVKGYGSKNELAAAMVDFFASNPEFRRELTTATSDFPNSESLGVMMCDALIQVTGADLALENGGGVRLEEKKAGSFTVGDVLRLDPFDNQCVEMSITGDEFCQMIVSCYENDDQQLPLIGGAKYELTLDPKDFKKVKGIKVFMPDGKRIKAKKKYKMACNSFVAVICDAPRGDQGEANGLRCSDILIKFLDGHAPIDYHDTRCATVINPPKTE